MPHFVTHYTTTHHHSPNRATFDRFLGQLEARGRHSKEDDHLFVGDVSVGEKNVATLPRPAELSEPLDYCRVVEA